MEIFPITVNVSYQFRGIVFGHGDKVVAPGLADPEDRAFDSRRQLKKIFG